MPSDAPRPVVEASPQSGGDQANTDERALRLRIRQQEILAELGVTALKGTPLTELLNEAVRLSAKGLEAEFCKVLEYIPSENRLWLVGTKVWWARPRLGLTWPRRRALPCARANR